jgi:hypothetical protein
LRSIAVSLALFLPAVLAARPKTDVVIIDNGDRILCEIKKLERGKLSCSTSEAGTISIKWTHVVQVSSEYAFQVQLESGARYIGTVGLSAEKGKLVVIGPAGEASLEIVRVVEMIPLQQTFFRRFKGSVDAGYDFTQSESATTWSASANLNYRTRVLDTNLSASSNVKEQTSATTVNRQDLRVVVNRFVGDRWFVSALGQGEKNVSQGLDYRGLLGGGAGRTIARTNKSNLAVLGGMAFSKEKFTDLEDADTNAEAVLGLTAETFRFDSPELDLSASFLFLPNLSTPGRYRLQANGKARIEIVRNLYWALTVYETYDSDPPSATSRKNDFGITTSLGWSLK